MNARADESLLRKCVRHLPLLLLLAYLGVVFDQLLFFTQGVHDADAFFHARYAQLMPEHGMSRSFRWMQFSLWRDAFCDKDFLYHAMMVPFTSGPGETLVGAKVFTLLLALSILLVAYLLLLRWKTPWPAAWVALLALGSGLFLSRVLMVRSHGMSVLLTLVAIYVLSRGRFWPCFAVGFVYAWSYSFPLAMVITGIGMELGRRALHGWNSGAPKAVLGAAAGVMAGLLIHPYSPNTLSTLWLLLNISKAGATGGSVELGTEFQPLQASQLLYSLSGLLPVWILCILGAAWLWKRKTPEGERALSIESASVLGAALGWFVGIFVFMRMIEYFAPAAVFASALVARDLLRVSPYATNGLPRQTMLAGILVWAVLLGGSQYFATQGIRGLIVMRRPYYPTAEAWYRGRYFEGATTWLKEHTQPGETIINFHWDDFTQLYYELPSRNYLVGLDPTLMQLKHPEEMRMLESMRTASAPLDFQKLGKRFGAKYIVMRAYRAQFIPDLKAGKYKPVYQDGLAMVFEAK